MQWGRASRKISLSKYRLGEGYDRSFRADEVWKGRISFEKTVYAQSFWMQEASR